MTKFLINAITWFALTATLELSLVALYGVYDYGMGPYQCGFIDAGHYCGILEYSINKAAISNLAFGIPTIVCGVIVYFALRTWNKRKVS